MSQWVRACAILTEDVRLVLATHVRLTATCNSSSGESSASGFHSCLYSCMFECAQTYTIKSFKKMAGHIAHIEHLPNIHNQVLLIFPVLSSSVAPNLLNVFNLVMNIFYFHRVKFSICSLSLELVTLSSLSITENWQSCVYQVGSVHWSASFEMSMPCNLFRGCWDYSSPQGPQLIFSWCSEFCAMARVAFCL